MLTVGAKDRIWQCLSHYIFILFFLTNNLHCNFQIKSIGADNIFDKKIKNFTVRLSQKMYNDLEINAKKYDLSKAEIIRMTIETYVMEWK